MACYFPVKAYQDHKPNLHGKKLLTFREKTAHPVTIPCGQCIGCRMERARQWALRLTHENQLHELSCFITLTYSPEYVPKGGTLVKKHFQDFMKRLRKKSGRAKIRFFHCGEYGATTERPHYHAIIFGLDFADKKFHSTTKGGHDTFTSETLERLWGYGHCLIGSVTPESVRYVSSYILKKITGKEQQKHYEKILPDGEIVNRLPPYVTMSRRPGIGEGWFRRFKGDVFPVDSAVDNGKPLAVPRYYSRLHFRENPEEEAFYKVKRKRKAKSGKKHQTPERLSVRNKVRLAQLKINERDEL